MDNNIKMYNNNKYSFLLEFEVGNGKQYLGLQQAWFLKNALDHKLGLIIFQID